MKNTWGWRTVLLAVERYERYFQKYNCTAIKHPTKTTTMMYPVLTSLRPMRASLAVSLPSSAPPATVSPIPATNRIRDKTRHCWICRFIFCSRDILQEIRVSNMSYVKTKTDDQNSHDSKKPQSCCNQGNHAGIEKDHWGDHYASAERTLRNNHQYSSGNPN